VQVVASIASAPVTLLVSRLLNFAEI